MVKTNKNMILIILVIGALIFFMQPTEDITPLKGAQADVSTAIITRSLSEPIVKVGATFTDTYIASGYSAGADDIWSVLITDTITGGCLSGTNAIIYAGFLSTSPPPGGITITAPASAGTCIFSGDYEFITSTLKVIQPSTSSVTICEDEDGCTLGSIGCTSSSVKWDCILSGDGVCNAKSETVCDANFVCSAGECEPVCAELETNAFNSIIAWVTEPVAANKATKRAEAVSTITLWILNC